MSDYEHKYYPPIEHVVSFDAAGMGPAIKSIRVSVNASASINYPDRRVELEVLQMVALGLTVKQSAQLRADLESAERAAIAACPSLEEFDYGF